MARPARARARGRHDRDGARPRAERVAKNAGRAAQDVGALRAVVGARARLMWRGASNRLRKAGGVDKLRREAERDVEMAA